MVQHSRGETGAKLLQVGGIGFLDGARAAHPRRLGKLGGCDILVSRRAQSRRLALEPVDLTLRHGEIVILAGGNGSGKTTLVKLISGLYTPASGVVRLDGRVVDDENREAYRQLFSAVYADGYLFPDFNGLGTATTPGMAQLGWNDWAWRQASLCQWDLVLYRPTLAGPTAAPGSAWHLLEDRPICILDESAANQDVSFKQLFYYKLVPELRAAGKALLVISHDDRYFDVANRVIRLQDGRLVDESLLAIDGTSSRGSLTRIPQMKKLLMLLGVLWGGGAYGFWYWTNRAARASRTGPSRSSEATSA